MRVIPSARVFESRGRAFRGDQKLSLWATAICALSLAACASYVPRPLTRGADLAPEAARLHVDVSRLRLTPLKAHRFDPAGGLDPTDIAILAVLNSPDLAAKRAGARVAAAQAFSAGLLPDPQLALNLDIPVHPGGGIVTAYNIAPSLDLVGLVTRSTALRAARATAAQADLDLLWSEWSAAQQARQLAVTILADESKAEVLLPLAAGLAARYRQSSAAFARGDVAAATVSADLAAKLDAEAQLAVAHHDAAKARADLNALIGLEPSATLRLVPAPPAPPATGRALDASLATLPDRRPDLLALKMGYGAQDATLRRAILSQFPLINIGFSHQRDNTGIVSNGPSATLVIPIFNRGRGDIAVQTATLERLAAEYQARLDQTSADVAGARRELDGGRLLLARLEAETPILLTQVARARGALNRGDIDSAAFLALEQAALKAQAALIDQRLFVAMAAISLQTVLFLPAPEDVA